MRSAAIPYTRIDVELGLRKIILFEILFPMVLLILGIAMGFLSIGHRYAEVGGYFTHPNEVIALTPDLKTAKALIGTNYDVDDLLAAARGGGDWIGRYGGWMLALLLLALLLSAIHLMTLFTGRPRMRSLNS